MEKYIKLILVSLFMSFIFVFNVNAEECSYEERKKLLNEAKIVSAFFEVDLDNNKFVFNLYNLGDDLYASLKDLSSNQSIDIYPNTFDGDHYTMDVYNVDKKVSYQLYIYSRKDNCYSKKLINKVIVKGVINKFYFDNKCAGITDFQYCKPVLNSEIKLTDGEVYKKIDEYRNSLTITQTTEIKEKFGLDDLGNIIKQYWYIFIIVIAIILIFPIFMIVRKKKGELK